MQSKYSKEIQDFHTNNVTIAKKIYETSGKLILMPVFLTIHNDNKMFCIRPVSIGGIDQEMFTEIALPQLIASFQSNGETVVAMSLLFEAFVRKLPFKLDEIPDNYREIYTPQDGLVISTESVNGSIATNFIIQNNTIQEPPICENQIMDEGGNFSRLLRDNLKS